MPALLRWQVFAAYGATFLAIWYYALNNKQEWSANVIKLDLLIDFGPLWAILVLGIYAVSSVVVGVVKFRDCPEAAVELNQEIAEAKAELKRRGIIQ
jgi:Dolichol-phosphate mannosyltransferase subunit 3 (DPM3)